jgi:hypothetical protein
LLLLLPPPLQITKDILKDIPDAIKSSIIEYTNQFEKGTISHLIKCEEDSDFQKSLDQANREFFYYVFQTISIVLKYPDAVRILKKVAESCYSGSLELENNIILSKKMRLAKDSNPISIATILLKSLRVLRNYVIRVNDQKIDCVKSEYYGSILESYSNISVCIAALRMILSGKVRAPNTNTNKLVKACGIYVERSKDCLEMIMKGNKPGHIYSSRAIDDIDSRSKIARSIGLQYIAQFDPNAIFRLDGIIGRQLLSRGKLDSVETVKSIRESVSSEWR